MSLNFSLVSTEDWICHEVQVIQNGQHPNFTWSQEICDQKEWEVVMTLSEKSRCILYEVKSFQKSKKNKSPEYRDTADFAKNCGKEKVLSFKTHKH